MHLDAKAVAQSKAFADQLRAMASKIKSGAYAIDESGSTLTAIVGTVVQSLGSETYDDARKQMAKGKTERERIVILLESVVTKMDQLNSMSDQTLSMLGAFGVNKIEWV
jgi:hypothetical protein